jgi:hypothetical protein
MKQARSFGHKFSYGTLGYTKKEKIIPLKTFCEEPITKESFPQRTD